MTTAAITGVNGQDGSYLAEALLEREYTVWGLIRREGEHYTYNIEHLLGDKRFHLIAGDLSDSVAVENLITSSQPDEIYNLAAQTFVGSSWDTPHHTMEVNYGGFLNVLEAARIHAREARIYQASTSEMYGQLGLVTDELYPMKPVSPYGISKLAAHRLAWCYRKSYGMYVACGILFNHESPRRPNHFVTQKIVHGALRAKYYGERTMLGNVISVRDWGYAPEYVEAMWHIMQRNEPDDFVIATGQCTSVADWAKLCFLHVNLDWKDWVDHSFSEFTRPVDVNYLCGDPTKAYNEFGWRPKVGARRLVKIMMEAAEKRGEWTSTIEQEPNEVGH